MADKIQVAVRVRPVLSQKKDVEIHWDASEKGMVVQIDPGTRKRIGNPYLFDQVFGSDTSNYQIFNCVVGPLIDSAMKGFNVTVLAYGQTASGKTYTMMGSPKELGIVQLAVDRIFTVIENSPEREFLLRCSYIEIYNETIQDLLSSSHQKLKVQELAEGNVVVQNLIEKNINSADAVMKLMQQGNKQRKVGGTSMNERSSRSHTIFRIIVESRLCSEEDGNDSAVTVSHINLVDLAGSEKASQTNATGDRFREGCAINTSLSALSLVIKQLSEGEGFVNFRDSKLTHILRASLGGNARTAIICNVTPTVLDETSSTLKFACSAKMVKNQPQVNEVLSDQALLRKYNNYIKDLEKKLKEKEHEHEKKPEAIEEMKKLLEEKDLKIQELKQQLVVSSSNESFVAPSDEISSKRSQRRMTWGGDVLKSFLKPASSENAPFMPSVPRPHRGSKFGDRFQPVTRRSRNNSFENIEECNDFENVGTESFVEANQFFSSANSSVDVSRVDASTMTDFPSLTPAKAIGTPAPVLRERLRMKQQEFEDLKEELHELCSFTRLEQQIGVHSYPGSKTSDEATEQLRQAQQTANDMEILYLDTQKKLSALQSEFREKQAFYEEELSTQKTTFQAKLEAETSEKKSLAKELAVLKDKCERLSRDQAEYDTHLAMVTDRSAKREADLRKNLQEAWDQLEKVNAGAAPTCTVCSEAKGQVQALEQQMKELERLNQEAQQQISNLNEELARWKTASKPVEKSVLLDDSLSGMCLADELRNAFDEDVSFAAASPYRRPRKRPSSILSVALAKMDHSSANETFDGVKRTRLSDPTSEGTCTDEIIVIRNHLIELQTVLLRYEEEFEILSREKEHLNSQLQAAQTQIAEVKRSSTPGSDPSSLMLEEGHSMAVEQSFDVSSLMADQTMSKTEVDSAAEKTKMEHELRNANNQIRQLQEELVATSGELTEARESLEDAKSVIAKLQEVGGEQQEELTNSNERVRLVTEELTAVSQDLSQTRQLLLDALAKFEAQHSEDDGLSHKLTLANEQMETMSVEFESEKLKLELELQNSVDQVRQLQENVTTLSSELVEARESLEDAKSVIQKMQDVGSEQQEELLKANERVQCLEQELAAASEEMAELGQSDERIQRLEQELAVATEELSKVRESLVEANSKLEQRLEADEQLLAVKADVESEKERLERELLAAGDQVQKLQEELGVTRQSLEQANGQLEATKSSTTEGDLNEAHERIRTLVEELTATSGDLFQTRVSLQEANSKIELEHSEKEELSKKLEEANERMMAMASEVETQKQKLEHELQRANNQIAQLQEDLASATNELIDAKEAHHEAQLQLKQIAQEADSSEMDHALQQKKVALEEACSRIRELESLRDTLDQKNAELEETRSRMTELEAVNENLRMKIVELEDARSRSPNVEDAGGSVQELEEARCKVIELEGINSDLQQRTAELEGLCSRLEDLEKLDDVLQRKGQELEEAYSKIKELESENEILQQNLEQSASEIDDLASIKESVQQKTAELENARSKLNELERVEENLQQKTLELDEAYSRITDLDCINANLQQKTEQLEDACSRYKELEGVSEVLLQRTEELDEACSRIKELEGVSDVLLQRTEELDEACSRIKQLEGVGDLLNQKIAELEEAHSRIKILEQASEAGEKTNEEFQMLHAEFVSQQSDLSAAQHALAAAAEEIRNLQKVGDERADELSKATDQVRSLLNELASATEDLSKTRQLLLSAEASVESNAAVEAELRAKLELASRQVEAIESEMRNAKHQIVQLQEDLTSATNELLETKEAHHIGQLRLKELEQAADKSEIEAVLQQKIVELQAACHRIGELEGLETALHQKSVEHQEACSRIRALEDVYERNEKLHEDFRSLQAELMSKEAELATVRQHLEDANDERVKMQKAAAEQQEDVNKANEKIRFLAEELTATTDDLSSTRVSLKEANAKIEAQHSCEEELKMKLSLASNQIMELSVNLEAKHKELVEAASRFEASRKFSSELQVNYAKATEEVGALQREIQLKGNELAAVCSSLNEASLTIEELQSRGDPQKLQADLNAAAQENQLLRQELESAMDKVSKAEEKLIQMSKMQNRGKSTPEPPIHVKLDLSVETLRRELAAAQARNETLRLSFETEEENRKKKIERLEKDNELWKEQYVRCKEELRLLRYRSNDEATINVPKSARSSVASQDCSIQTEPISDKGFGFRWQMEQYVADNERLRKKVSDLGEKMEYYKSKLIKYRGMYQEITGQAETNPKAESHRSPAVSAAANHDSPVSNVASEVMSGPNVRQLRERFSAPPAGSVPENRPLAGTVQSAEGFPAGLRKPMSGMHAPSQFSGQKKETLTKEEMEKINNCNPS